MVTTTPRQSCSGDHRVIVLTTLLLRARACAGKGGVRARARARWASGHDNSVTIATAQLSHCRRHRVVVAGTRECRRGQGGGKGEVMTMA